MQENEIQAIAFDVKKILAKESGAQIKINGIINFWIDKLLIS